MQSNCAIAAILGSGGEGVIATLGVCLTIPCVSVASLDGLFCLHTIIDSQVQSGGAVATILCGGGKGVITTRGISLAIPCITVASYNSLFCLYTLINSQV